MKLKIMLPTIVVMLTAISSRAMEPVQLSLDGEWSFTYTAPATAAVPQLPPAKAYDCRAEVPGRWDSQLSRFEQAHWRLKAVFRTALGPVQYLSGTGWYRREIAVPDDWSGRAATLKIGGAVGTIHVWLNGKHLGSYAYGAYTPYEVDLTDALHPGVENELIIAVDNTSSGTFGGWAFLGNAGLSSGLTRPVTLNVAAGPGSIADVYVRPGDDLKDVVWTIDLKGPAGNVEIPGSKLVWTVRDSKKQKVLGTGEVKVPEFLQSRQVIWQARLDSIKPWSDRDPNLYYTELRWLTSDGKLLDVCEQRFGLRRWSFEGRRLFLNGEPHYLRLEFGAYYFPLEGYVSTSKSYWLEHMKRLKELGLNGINFAAQVCPVEMMEAADELGVILQTGDHLTTRDEAKQVYREVWSDIVRTTRKYPSVGIYGFGGELKYYEGVIEQNKAQMDLIRELHPESLVMPQQAIHGIDYGIEDPNAPGVSRVPFLHHSERLARYTKACDLFGHHSVGAFSHSYFGTPWREMEERFRIYKKPLVAHELFISASYLNPENAAKYTGRIPPYIYTRLENGLRDAGLLEKWPTYFDHTSRLQHICRKYALEKARKCDGLAGFELLGMMDMHFITPEYAVGIVDEFLSMKPGDTEKGVRRYIDESVLLLDFDHGNGINRNYWEGETFTADVFASLYGPRKLDRGTLSWVLKNGDEIVGQGTDQVTDVAHGCVSKLKEIEFKWPEVEETTRLNLSFQLRGNGYELANDWDFWVFPKKSPPVLAASADTKARDLLKKRYPGVTALNDEKSEQLRVVSQLGTSEVEHLEKGGDVVLFGAAPFTEYKQWPYFYPAKGYRPFSNGGTVLAKHPVFSGHPNEGWGDWHFYPLLQGANCVQFDGAIDMVFDPILEIVSSAGHVRKHALIFEQRVGKGRLFVATTVFDLANPSCVTLLDSIVGYVQGAQFAPKHSLDPQELRRALAPTVESGNKLADFSFERSGYWIDEGGTNKVDTSTAHEGKKSLKLIVTDDDLRGNRNFVSGVSTRNITFPVKPRRLKLSGWFKSDRLVESGQFKVLATIRYEDAHMRSTAFSLDTAGTTDEWRYLEKTIDLDGAVTVATVQVSLSGTAGTVWVDNLYFGEPQNEPVSQPVAESQEEQPKVWQNHKFTASFRSPVWFRIDQGEWDHGTTIQIDQEGVHTVSWKKLENDLQPIVQLVSIDLTPPTTTLTIVPLPEQEAGIFTATADTEFSFQTTDNLSGVRTIEVATNGSDFAPYTKPFQLPAGKHVIRCRTTDYAGNESASMLGEWITGSEEDFLEIEILPALTPR